MEEDYPLYNVHRAGLLDDNRKSTSNELSAARESALNDMLNLILNHKKEIIKVPTATTFKGAKDWCAKRPGSGFRAEYRDIGGDPDKEVVVFDKAGRPFMVNGYKLKPSDYGLRKAYFEANPTSVDRAGNPMKQWTQDFVWKSEKDPKNVWNRTVSKNQEEYDKMKAWGYRMPTKPKTQISPYAIFSKTIAADVKTVLKSDDLFNRFAETLGNGGKFGDNNKKILAKIISPISIYRYLFMRLVEQVYYVALTGSPQTQKLVSSYDTYKKFVSRNKATFRNWFMENYMDARHKYERFVSAMINEEVIKDALVREEINWDGSDLQDGIVYLLGPANIDAEFTLVDSNDGEEQEITFKQLLTDNELAGEVLTALSSKHYTYYKSAKQTIEKIKKNAQKSMEAYFKNEKMRKQFFEDSTAADRIIKGIEAGVPNATDDASIERQQAAASSPAKIAPVEIVPDAEPVDGASADPEELKQFDEEEQ